MTSLSSKQLAQMRSVLAVLLPDICAILSPTNGVDAEGNYTQSWGTVSASTACRLDAQGGGDRMTGGAIVDYRTYILTVPYDTTLNETYRILHGGVTYAVTSTNADNSWPIVRRAIVERI
jgi:hypothetical protein